MPPGVQSLCSSLGPYDDHWEHLRDTQVPISCIDKEDAPRLCCTHGCHVICESEASTLHLHTTDFLPSQERPRVGHVRPGIRLPQVAVLTQSTH